jgi:hypothetical protein
MSERREAQGKEHDLASGAKPRLEERVRERGWQPSRRWREVAMPAATAARPRAIARARHTKSDTANRCKEGA